MTDSRRHLELLAPARNADIGIEAVNHGADAVYIGGPSFGARAGAGNEIGDIARLVEHAHKFNAKIFVTLNTILHDNELDAAHALVWQIYEAGADALIVQDMGLLEMDLPPIQLHASTQTDIRTVEKAAFLDQVGFSQIVLARELDLPTIKKIAGATTCNLEFFIHGALCVAFSGQCFISHAHTGRSANRGECSQACRLPYTLEDSQGRILANDKHLLSVKDNDQSANLRALIDAGISSFKIEGRYKDAAYVKNATAHYRQLLDEILEDLPGYGRSSSGKSTYTFTPQPEKTFNRSATDYFVNGRQAGIGAFDTPKFAGEEIGRVTKVGKDFIEVETAVELHNGDGISFFDSHKELVGLRINTVENNRIRPDEMPADVRRGMTVYRNRDHAFLRLLEKPSAERKIGVSVRFFETPQGYTLMLTDEDGYVGMAELVQDKQPAQNAERAESGLREGLAKLGNTDFVAEEVTLDWTQPWFIPASGINALRREAVKSLQTARQSAYQRPQRREPVEPPVAYPEETLDYLANVYNQKARDFYAKHGVKAIAAAYEANEEQGEVSLMITKHCLRYSFAMCPKEAKGVIGVQGTITAEPMTLVNGKERLTLRFDCKKCEMHVMGKIRKSVLQMPQPQPMQFFSKRPSA
ncbi:putative protease [Novimethylophilus kurashikiensis]|uniref:Putative protease n=1 Tax=Novimethylophilus kurashikiensis TaxID=1825523 RepID=A0A2R5FEJ4_9PROT|nr:U32 family peptidase [Novimethylophilus kurashikiensis]GBG15798.1 putative protease [Novimethylophilus kurashikiensis]